MAGPLSRLAEDAVLSVFFSVSLYFVVLVSLASLPYATIGLAAFTILFCGAMVALAFVAMKFRKGIVIPAILLLLLLLYGVSQTRYMSSVALSFFMLTFPFAWLMFAKRKRFAEAVIELKITKEKWLLNIFLGIIVTLFFLYPLMLAEVFIFGLLGITDIQNVGTTILDAPIWLAIFAFTFAPFGEEMFFRSFLVPRMGIIGSSFLFMLAHYSYGSITEFVGAFTIGILFAFLFLRTRSFVAVAAAHVLFNLISIAVIYLGSWFG